MDLGKNIQKSVDLYMKNFGTLFGAGVVAVLLSAITFGILAGPVLGGFLVMVLKVIRGEKAEFNEIFAHFDKFVPTLIVCVIGGVVMIIAGIIPILGILLGLVVNPIVSLVVAFALVMVIEKSVEPMDALKQGFESIKANLVMYWLFSLIMSFISGLGAIACIIGVFATMPLSSVGMAVAYDELNNQTPVDGPSVTA